MDFAAARQAMVDTQIRPNNVRDPRIVAAFSAVPREVFIPMSRRALAYSDDAVPVSLADSLEPPRWMLSPMALGKLLQAALPLPSDRVLDIGGAMGYSAAVVSRLSREVFALEASDAMADAMRDTLAEAGFNQIKVSSGMLSEGMQSEAPFSVILINGSIPQEPRALFDQLAEDGRLVCILGSPRYGQAYLYLKTGGIVSGRPIFDLAAHALPGFAAEPVFVF